MKLHFGELLEKIYPLYKVGVCCVLQLSLAERVKTEPGSILQCEEQAATLPDLIHFLHRKWRRRISAHTAISSLIFFCLSTPPPKKKTKLLPRVGINGQLVFHVCLDRQQEKGRAEAFQTFCAVTKIWCCLSERGKWILTGNHKLMMKSEKERHFPDLQMQKCQVCVSSPV